jgi:hypothetical protein
VAPLLHSLLGMLEECKIGGYVYLVFITKSKIFKQAQRTYAVKIKQKRQVIMNSQLTKVRELVL